MADVYYYSYDANGNLVKKKKEKESPLGGWLQKGSEESVAKTILGTGADVVGDLLAGAIGMGEGIVDFGATVAGGVGKLVGADQFASNMKQFVSKDLYDENAIAKEILSGINNAGMAGSSMVGGTLTAAKNNDKLYKEALRTQNYVYGNMENDSVLGEKADSVVQSIGQMLTTSGVAGLTGVPWEAITAVTSFGDEMDNALKSGADFGAAIGSSAISAAGEVLGEKLFSGSFLGEKGIFGNKAKDVSNSLGKGLAVNLWNTAKGYLNDMKGEAIEEVFSQAISNLGSALYKEKSLGAILADKEALQGYLDAAIGGALMGGVANAKKATVSAATGKDYDTGLTQNEQKVFKAEYDSRVAEAEKGGKIDKKEQQEIYDAVLEDIRKGNIDTDTIEKVLGGEAYSKYEATVKEEESLPDRQKTLQDELEALRMKDMTAEESEQAKANEAELLEIEKKLAAPASKEMRKALSDNVFKMVEKDSNLRASYYERGKRSQKFEANLDQYNAKQREVVKKAVESGILNNTRKTHELVDFVAKASDRIGTSFNWTNNQKLVEAGYALEGKTVNGFVNQDGITLNINSGKALHTVVGHEITHVLEGTELYGKLSDAVVKYAKAKGVYNKRLADIKTLYEGVENAQVDRELVADLVGDYLFTDTKFLDSLVQDQNLFQRLWNEVRYLYNIATAGSDEAKQLLKVKKAFEKAYRDGGKVSNDTKYSLTIKHTNGTVEELADARSLTNEQAIGYLEQAKSGSLRRETYIPVRKDTPQVIIDTLAEYGESVGNLSMVMQVRKAQQAMSSENAGNRSGKYGNNVRKHALSPEEVVAIVNKLDDPNIVILQTNRKDKNGTPLPNNVAVFVEYTNNGNEGLAVIEFESSINPEFIGTEYGDTSYHTVVTVFEPDVERNGMEFDYAEELLSNPYNIELEIKRGQHEESATGEKHPNTFSELPSIEDTVPHPGDSVKHYSISDSDGKQLTKEQQEYFKDSKVRDEGGNLKVMYQGGSGDFTVFDRKKSSYSNLYGRGFYFTDSESHAKQYGDARAFYLDIKNPVPTTERTITEDQMRKFLEAVAENDEDYSFENYGYGATVDSVLDSIYSGKSDFAMLYDVSQTAIGDMVAAVELFNEVNGTNYDGLILDTETVTFQSNQAKLTDNLKPTADADIRYSLSESASYAEIAQEQYKLGQRERDLNERKREANSNPELLKALDDYHGLFTEMRELLPKRKNGTATQAELDRIEEIKLLKDEYLKRVADLQENLGLNALAKEEEEIRKTKEELRKASDAAWEREGAEKENKAIEKSGLSAPEYFRKKALKAFKTTANFNEAGYMLPDGKLLNFSGGERNHRYRDHREIGEIYEATQGTAALNRFLNDGNIRIMAESPGIDLAAGVEPTHEQYAALRRFIKSHGLSEGQFFVDISGTDGRRVGKYSYEGRVNADRVLNDIKYFYQNGEVREQSSIGQFLSLSNKDKADLAPIGDYHIYGRDIALEEIAPPIEDIAPVREDIAPVKATTPKKIATANDRTTEQLNAAYTELTAVNNLRETSLADFNKEIANLQAEYDSKKNKNTNVANELLRRIERTKARRDSVDAAYQKSISDVEARISKLSSSTYKTAMQRKAKQEQYTAMAEKLAGDTSTWVDKKLGIQYQVNTLKRNLRDVVRTADGKRDIAKADAIYDELQGKYNHNEALLNRRANNIKGEFAKLKITDAENVYIQMLGELRHNPETTLSKEMVDEFYNKNKATIDEAKVDKAIDMARKMYDQLFADVNAVLKEQGMKEIPYRKGYFPHFVDEKQNLLAKLLNWKKQNNHIPTDIAGLTENFTPNRSWQSFNKQRTSDVTDYNFLKGMDGYVRGSLDWIYHIEDIQKRRAFENYIRYVHSDAGVKEKINKIINSDEYDANEAQELIDGVYAEANNPLGNFVTDLRASTNKLAGKKMSMDRGMEAALNRDVYSTMSQISNRVSANMVGGSISSALTNFIPITQSWGEVSPVSSLRAMRDTIRSHYVDDGVVDKSDFLTNRLNPNENLYKTKWDKVSDAVGGLMEVVDNFTSQTVWRSKYMENISNGMSENAAIKNADEYAAGLMADRSRGNMPTLFEAKNPVAKMVTAFQLEVANQYAYMLKDMPQNMKDQTTAKLVKGYLSMFIGAYAYNALYSSLVGRDAAFDPIRILEDLLRGIFDEEEEPADVAMNFVDDVLEEVPFVGGLLGGGRIPIASALPFDGNLTDTIEGIGKLAEFDFSDVTTEWMNPVYYLLLPTGGGQLRKTNQGLSMFDDDLPIAGSYTKSGNLRFTVDETPANVLQAALFGQYASKNARQYFDENRTPLSEKQIQELKDVDIPIADYWKYRDGLKDLNKLNEKADYIASLDLPVAKKNILINNIADREEPIDLTDYNLFADFEEFDWASKNPGKYTLSKAITNDVTEYKQYTSDLDELKADKDKNGKAISGSAKAKKLEYINSLNIDYGKKLLLYKSLYPSDSTYDSQILQYLGNRDDLSVEELITILEELGFKVNN